KAVVIPFRVDFDCKVTGPVSSRHWYSHDEVSAEAHCDGGRAIGACLPDVQVVADEMPRLVDERAGIVVRQVGRSYCTSSTGYRRSRHLPLHQLLDEFTTLREVI